jgi:hypothetical protein
MTTDLEKLAAEWEAKPTMGDVRKRLMEEYWTILHLRERRCPWNIIGATLGIRPDTVSRTWLRLQKDIDEGSVMPPKRSSAPTGKAMKQEATKKPSPKAATSEPRSRKPKA